MKTIHKFMLTVTDLNTLEMPVGAEILCLQVQRGNPCLWALVNTDAPKCTRRFVTIGTGHPMPTALSSYIGTYQIQDSSLVFHVFAL